jgi:hypothetical protein
MILIAILFYSAVFIFLLYIHTRNNVPLTPTTLALAFLFKVGLGCLYGYVYLHFYNGDDTWMFHNDSLAETQKLLHNTGKYFAELGPADPFANVRGNFWNKLSVYVNNLETYSLIKTLSIANLFSRGNYYINVVFFNYILFWGQYWLFSLFVKEFPDKRTPLLLLFFFFPPLVFWLSGIRADGLVLFFMALLLIHFRRWLYENKKWSVLYSMLAAIGVLLFRGQILLLLIPALMAWYISIRFNRKAAPAFLWVFAIGGLLFFATAWLSPAKNLPRIVVERQQSFMREQGTRFPLDTLQPSLTSFTKVLPQAVSHTFLRPYVWEAKGLLQVMTAAAIIVFWLLVLIAIIKKEMHWKQAVQKPLLLFSLSLGITLYIFIGYTIPFPGAIVRYKAIPELLLLTIPVICTNWAFLRKINKKLHI